MFNAKVAWVPSVFSLVAWMFPVEYRATMRHRGAAIAQVILTLLMVLVILGLSAGVILTEHWHCYKQSIPIRDYNQGRCNDPRAPAHAWHKDYPKPWEIGLYTICGVVICAFVGVRIFWLVKLVKAGKDHVPVDHLKRMAAEGKISKSKWALLRRKMSQMVTRRTNKKPPHPHSARVHVAEVMLPAFLYPVMVLIGYSSFALKGKPVWRIAARYFVTVGFCVTVILVGVWGHQHAETCCYKEYVPHDFGSCQDSGSQIRTTMRRLSHSCIHTHLPLKLSVTIGVMSLLFLILYVDCYIDYHTGHLLLRRHYKKIDKEIESGATPKRIDDLLYITPNKKAETFEMGRIYTKLPTYDEKELA